MADAALVGGCVCVATSKFLVSILVFGQETPEFSPNVDVL